MKINKEELLNKCMDVLNHKLQNIQKAINSYQQDLNSETKSSAGDKHETGRAMLQLEMEKLGQQYQNVIHQKNRLDKIDITLKNKIQLGSLVIANNTYYFLAESIGQVKLNKVTVMVISAYAPISKLFIGKQVGDDVKFNGKTIIIDSVL